MTCGSVCAKGMEEINMPMVSKKAFAFMRIFYQLYG
jgi:hypothetical protein